GMRLAHGARLGATSHPRVRAVPPMANTTIGWTRSLRRSSGAAHLSPPVPRGERGGSRSCRRKSRSRSTADNHDMDELYTELTRPMAKHVRPFSQFWLTLLSTANSINKVSHR